MLQHMLKPHLIGGIKLQVTWWRVGKCKGRRITVFPPFVKLSEKRREGVSWGRHFVCFPPLHVDVKVMLEGENE